MGSDFGENDFSAGEANVTIKNEIENIAFLQ